MTRKVLLLLATLFILLVAVCGCAGPGPMTTPEHAGEAVSVALGVYQPTYHTNPNLRIQWFYAYWLETPDNRITRGYSIRYRDRCEISVIATDRISDGPLMHEIMHCMQPVPTQDADWSEEDRILVDRANDWLRRYGL